MFEDIRSILHVHSRNRFALAQTGRGIPCFGTTHADYFYGEVPVTRPMTASRRIGVGDPNEIRTRVPAVKVRNM
jgi:L-ribulose-5-phosphate 4-epimerase